MSLNTGEVSLSLMSLSYKRRLIDFLLFPVTDAEIWSLGALLAVAGFHDPVDVICEVDKHRRPWRTILQAKVSERGARPEAHGTKYFCYFPNMQLRLRI